MREFTVIVKDRPGALAEVTEAFAKSAINLKAISTEVFEGRGRIKVVTDDERTARTMLEKSSFEWEENDILAVEVPDKPGALAKEARKMADAGVYVKSVYVMAPKSQRISLVFGVEDLQKAKKSLRKVY